MMSALGKLLLDLLLGFFWWGVLLPILLVLVAPWGLVISLFVREPWSQSVRRRFSAVFEFWKEHGWALTP